MRKLATLVAVLASTSTVLTGCIPLGGCGVDKDYAKGTDGEWIVTRMFTDQSPCPSFDEPEQLDIDITAGEVTVLSPGIELLSQHVWQDGDRHLVEITVGEQWFTPEIDPGFVSAPVTYELELVPASARLEGTVSSSFPIDTQTTGTTCSSSGNASAGRVTPAA